MTAVGKSTASAEAPKPGRDYAAALAMLVNGDDPDEVSAITGMPLRIVLTLWEALDGEASGTMRRFGSVIDPRYRPRSELLGVRRSRTPAKAKVLWSTR